MIPKIIHYCWFGNGKKGKLFEKCMNSWKKFCPDFEFIEWNETNIDINSNQYMKEAYEAKKWAFVTDYVRLYVLHNYGGVYMDTDVELINPIERYLHLPAFTGFETDEKISTAIMGAEKQNEWIGYLLSYYDNKSFYIKEGQYNLKTNVETITEMTKSKYSIQLDGKQQEIKGLFKIYPKDYFCPKDYATGEITLTNNTVCIHHFNASWHSKIDKKIYEKKIKYIKKYGVEIGERKYQSWYRRSKLMIHIQKYGIKKTCKSILKKIVLWGAKSIYGENIVLFESLNGFDGNAGAVYEYMIRNEKYNKYKFVWFLRERKPYHNSSDKRTYIYEFGKKNLKKTIFNCLASTIFYDNIPIPRKNNKQKIIYLTHGCPVLKNVKGIINVPDYVDYVICTSKDMLPVISYQFSANKEKLFINGLPRNDYLFRKNENINILFERKNYRKVIIWLPTFRKSAYENRNDTSKELRLGIPLIENNDELEKINKKLQQLNILLVLKTHPGQDNSVVKLKKMSHIVFVTEDILRENNINLYSLLSETDALLSDYSSVSFDYMLLDRPIGYIIDDINEYKLGFAFESVTDMMPGFKIQTLDNLFEFIDTISENKDIFKDERRKILKMTNEYKDNKNTERLLKYFNV